MRSYVDAYMNNFNELDKQIRGNSVKKYLQPFDMYEKLYLMMITLLLNIFTFPYKSIHNIPWKFAKAMKNIENNFPHTHKDVIILPYDFFQKKVLYTIRTILHEKVHIYQRYNPIPTIRLYIEYWGLKVYDYSFHKKQRSNPDTNHMLFCFYNPKKNTMQANLQIYKPNPKTLSDSKLITLDINEVKPNKSTVYYDILYSNPSYQKEHPNEIMACLLTDMIIHKKKHSETTSFLFKHS